MNKTYYTIYQINHISSGKIYIGQHQTKNLDDGYMGSGKQLKRAQKKHGLDDFEKKILYIFDNENEMNAKEAELVSEEFCSREDTYNICPGGQGGFGYLNTVYWSDDKRRQLNKHRSNRRMITMSSEERSSVARLGGFARPNNPTYGFKGKIHSEETKHKISETRKRQGNGCLGAMWITNGNENKRIKKDVDLIPEGWYKGRTIR